MDPHLVAYPRENRNRPGHPVNGIGDLPDRRWDNFRDNFGYLIRYSSRLDLTKATPRPSLFSTGYCLVQTLTAGAWYLAYAPYGGWFAIDLSAMSSSRRLKVEWFTPATSESIHGKEMAAGNRLQIFEQPFNGDAVLYLADVAGRSQFSH